MNSRTNTLALGSIVSSLVFAASALALSGPAGAAAEQTTPAADGAGQKGGKLFDWVRFQIADFDRSGFVDEQDVFSYIDVWMAGKPGADTNGNGVVDSDDLYMFYLIWLSVVEPHQIGGKKSV